MHAITVMRQLGTITLRTRGLSVVLTLTSLLVGASQVASGQLLNADSGPVSSDNFELPSIPISAVAGSDNCARIADLEERLEGPANGKSNQPIDAPEPRATLGASGKLRLAMRNFSDPLNLAGMAIDSAVSNATSSSNSAFGTGWPGFGRRFGMSVADEGLNEFFSTFLISTLAHQDPHYHRDPGASRGRRIVYALSRVVVASSDSGKPMFNVAEFAGTTASSLVETTYHYERDEGPKAVSARIFVSIGSDAVWNLMNEFLPDIARRVNPRFIFLRRLAERAAKQY
jgi:hypothetical protein